MAYKFGGFFIKLRRYTVIGKQLLISNDKNRVRWAVFGLLLDEDWTDLLENFSVNSLKWGLSNDTITNPPLFSLVNTFKRCPSVRGFRRPGLALRRGSLSLCHYLVLGVLPLAILWQWCRRRKGTQAAEGHPMCRAGRRTCHDIYKKYNIKCANSKKVVSKICFLSI